MTEAGLEVSSGGETVHLQANAGDCICTCPADGICRHILAAIMQLATTAENSAETDTAMDPSQIRSAARDQDDNTLNAWAGKRLIKQALSELSRGLTISVKSDDPLVLRVEEWSQEVRWLNGGTLSDTLCSCHAPTVCVHRVAAILGLQVLDGTRVLDLKDPLLEAFKGVVRTRSEVLEAVGHLLTETIEMGLTRSASGLEERFRSLATAAHGVDLPRLERELSGFADNLRALREREGSIDSSMVLRRAAGLEALRCGLENAKPGLVGRHRARYVRVRELELMGLGGRVWETPSGYRGLTLSFLDVESGHIHTWTDARPTNLEGYDPLARFMSPGPWTGCANPAKAAVSTMRLTAAWRSAGNRISGRESTRAYHLGNSAADKLPWISDWSLLGRQLRDEFDIGLVKKGSEGANLVMLKIKEVVDSRFDRAAQRWRATLLDAEDRPLLCQLPYSELRSAAITCCEQSAEQWRGVIGYMFIHEGNSASHP